MFWIFPTRRCELTGFGLQFAVVALVVFSVVVLIHFYEKAFGFGGVS